METISLTNALRRVRDSAIPGPLPNYFRGLLIEDSGPPDTSTPTEAVFYVNAVDDSVYYLDTNRGQWTQVVDGAPLADQTVLTASV